jgi:SAM-dependent methyltransferase
LNAEDAEENGEDAENGKRGAVDLSQRATETELLDEDVPEAEALESLADLRRVNQWLGTHRRLREVTRPFLSSSPRPRLLDVGCGSADIPDRIRRSFPRPLLAVGVDIRMLHLRAAPPSVRRVVADVHALPFPSGAFDVVLASHFLHHFDGAEAAAVLRRLYDLARRALIVDDIRRARVPYVFARSLFPLLLRSRVSVADGALSIRRAFTAAELASAFAEAGIPVRIRRVFPYRLLAVAQKAA